MAGEPLYFPSGEHQLFGWLHRTGDRPPTDLGLVICKPFGYESICAHRSVRAFAQAAAARGVAALRFDYLGTGDSSDVDANADQVQNWTRDVVAAVRALQATAGVKRVCLLGFRLGALLATLAASDCEAIAGVAVVAPVVSGRRYLRELRVIQLAASQVAVVAPNATNSEDAAGTAATGTFEVAGFSLSQATMRSLSQLDLMNFGQVPAAQMLVIDRSDLPGAQPWADLLIKLGARTKYVCLPGTVEMLWTAAHFAVTPLPMIAAIDEWLAEIAVPSPKERHTAKRHNVPDDTAHLSVAAAQQLRLGSMPIPLLEQPVHISRDPALFGIVTLPAGDEARRRGVILLNDAATYHIGSNRLYVSLARRWAQRGYYVLRMDLSGLGDSEARPGRVDNEVFPPEAIVDMRAAVELLRDRYGVREVTLGGLCAGAYHALRGAAAGLPIDRVLLINPQNFYWKQGTVLSDLQIAEVVRNPGIYRERVLSFASWKRLLTGRVNLWRITQIYAQRLWLGLNATVRDAARSVHIHLAHDLGGELTDIAGRGVRVVFVFSQGEAGIDLLRIEAGSSIKRLGDRCHVHVIPNADHIFSQNAPRQQLEEILSEELFAAAPNRQAPRSRAVSTLV